MQIDAETGAQRSCKQTATGGSSDERKGIQIYLDGACRRSLVYHYIDAIVFHCRVEILLDDGRQTVNLVDEEHVARFERCEYASEVARLVEHGSACYLESHAKFVGNDVAQCGLA